MFLLFPKNAMKLLFLVIRDDTAVEKPRTSKVSYRYVYV